MKRKVLPHCADCEDKQCSEGTDCFSKSSRHRRLYDDAGMAELHKAASAIEARYYCKETRLGEIILLAKELGCKRIGLAFCIGLAEEAKVINEILSKHFEVASVCCKLCGLAKEDFGLEKIKSGDDEVMCNPAGQADVLNEAQTEINVICGLCVGHDAIFSQVSKAPVTTLIVKDRILAHNPVAALYCRYIRKKFQ